MKIETTEAILRGAADQLLSARIGLDLLRSQDAEKRAAGLRNVIVFGRAFTNAIQKLRSQYAHFDEWYQPWVDRLKQDSIARTFYRMRSEILKEGITDTASRVHIEHLNVSDMWKLRPPNATGFFIGDQQGRSGWNIQQADGSIETLYVQFPEGSGINVSTEIILRGLPDELANITASEAAEHYLAILIELDSDARRTFKAMA